MKRFSIALLSCCLVGLVAFFPNAEFAAVSSAQQQAISRTIAQDPVDPDVDVDVDVEDISLVVEAPTKVKIGDLVVLSVEKSNAVSFEWIVLPSTDNFLVIDEGRRAVFSCGESGEFIFIVACAKGDDVRVKYHKLVVTGPPKPEDGIKSVIVALCDRVESQSKRDDVLKLAQSFSSVAAAMAQGGNWTPVDIAKATKISNQDALGERLTDWNPFAEGLAKTLQQMNSEGKLVTTEDHIAVWRKIADALREYASNLE